MSLGNSSFNRQKSRKEIFKVINNYIKSNNIAHINGVGEEESENNN